MNKLTKICILLLLGMIILMTLLFPLTFILNKYFNGIWIKYTSNIVSYIIYGIFIIYCCVLVINLYEGVREIFSKKIILNLTSYQRLFIKEASNDFTQQMLWLFTIAIGLIAFNIDNQGLKGFLNIFLLILIILGLIELYLRFMTIRLMKQLEYKDNYNNEIPGEKEITKESILYKIISRRITIKHNSFSYFFWFFFIVLNIIFIYFVKIFQY